MPQSSRAFTKKDVCKGYTPSKRSRLPRECGVLQIYKKNDIEGEYQRGITLLDKMASRMAEWGADCYRRDKHVLWFWSEFQLPSILVPTLWDIAKQRGSVLTECLKHRKQDPDASVRKKSTNRDSGWVDYRIKVGKTVHLLETKLCKSDYDFLAQADIQKKWGEAENQLKEIKGKARVDELRQDNHTLFKTAIMFIPIFKSVEKQRPELDTLLGYLEPKPHWIGEWSFPGSMQRLQDKEGKHYSEIVIIAHIYGKYDKS